MPIYRPFFAECGAFELPVFAGSREVILQFLQKEKRISYSSDVTFFSGQRPLPPHRVTQGCQQTVCGMSRLLPHKNHPEILLNRRFPAHTDSMKHVFLLSGPFYSSVTLPLLFSGDVVLPVRTRMEKNRTVSYNNLTCSWKINRQDFMVKKK